MAICSLKRFVADWVYEHREELEKQITPHASRLTLDVSKKEIKQPKAKVAIVGAGPAGLAALTI